MAEELKRYDENGLVIIDKDFHTHTVYSHGKGTVRQNVERARELGLSTIAITDHGMKHYLVGVSKKHLLEQKAEIREIQKDFPDVKILFGIESDILGMSGKIDIEEDEFDMFDIVLCGYHKPVLWEKWSDIPRLHYNAYSHYVYAPTAKQIANDTEAYINTIVKNPIDILTHPNYHLRIDCYEVAKVCEQYGTVMEISTRHQDMTDADYEAILKTNVMFAINSDAHKIENIANVTRAKEVVKKFQIPADRIVNAVGTEYVMRSAREKNRG